MSEGEIWKDVEGFEGFYKVSNRGNVYSIVRKDSRGQKRGGFTLKPTHARGYPQVNLYKDGERKHKLVHRLVAGAFIPNPNNFPEVNHIDEVKDNNDVRNLEWCTGEYNNNYGTRTERVVKKTSKKVRAVNVKTGEVFRFKSTAEAQRKGYNSGNISLACRGIYKNGDTGKLIGDGRTYKGHRWYYEEEGE